jgi:hypothetical protein
MKSQPYLIALRKKIPPFQEITGLYATIVFLVYGWTSVAFFWKVPSWKYFLDLAEIAVLLAYILASSLLESALILVLFLFASLLLPSRWLSNKFVVRGSIILYSLTFWVVLFDLSTQVQPPTKGDVISFVVGFPLTTVLGIKLANKIPSVRRFMTSLSDQLTIFLYVWLPLSLIGILIVILRII